MTENVNNIDGEEVQDISTSEADALMHSDWDPYSDGASGSVQDILSELGSAQSSLLVGFQDHLKSLAEQRDLPAGEYLDDLPEDIKAKKLQDVKLQNATERRAKVREEYEAQTKAAHEKLAERREALREELFDDVSTSTMMTVTLADDSKIEDLIKAAVRSGSNGLPLAKAILPSLYDRGLDHLAMPILEAHPTLQSAWSKWQALPEKSVLERQLDPANIEQVVPTVSADRLQVRPRTESY